MTATRSGMRLGDRYRLSERLAFGGMGEVWSGLDEVLGRAVAVKILRPELARDDAFRRRFREEARTAGGLSHPGIAAVYDYGEGMPSQPVTPSGPDSDPLGSPPYGNLGHGRNTPGREAYGQHEPDWTSGDDVAYLVMELVPGKPLSAILAECGPLPPVRALELVAQAARGLHAAHQRGVVHRDVKPANLMVTPDGRVKVTDFGIARPQDHEPLTATGQVMGTAHYLAPELARGHLATALSDVYALGVVAYECVAGRRPFEGDNQVAVATAHLSEHPPPLAVALPPDVRRVIMTAMQKEPEYRFTTADTFAEVLDFVRFRLLAADPPPIWATRGPVPGVGTTTLRLPGGDPRMAGAGGASGFLAEIGAGRGGGTPGTPENLGGRAGHSDTAALPLGRRGRPRPATRRTPLLPLLAMVAVLAALVVVITVKSGLIGGSDEPSTGSSTPSTSVSTEVDDPLATGSPTGQTSTTSRPVYGGSNPYRGPTISTPLRTKPAAPTSARPTGPTTNPPKPSPPPTPTTTTGPPTTGPTQGGGQ